MEQHKQYIEKLQAQLNYNSLTGESLFHAARRMGIGGSDVAAILGLSKWSTPHQVWLQKTGRAEPIEPSPAMHWGTQLESVIADEYESVTGTKVGFRGASTAHKQKPWLAANVDGLTEDKAIEIKTANAFAAKDWGDSGTDQVPDQYLCQVMHYMAITGRQQADIAVLIGGSDFRIYTVDFNESLYWEEIEPALTQFWFDYVLTDLPPPAESNEEITELFQKDNGQSIAANPELMEVLAERAETVEVKKEAEELIKQQDARIKRFMGENQTLLNAEGGKLATWKNQTSNRIDSKRLKAELPEVAAKYSKPSTSRTFKVVA